MFVSLFKSFEVCKYRGEIIFTAAPVRSSPMPSNRLRRRCIASSSIDVVFSAFCQANVFEYCCKLQMIFAPQRLVVGSCKSSSDAKRICSAS